MKAPLPETQRGVLLSVERSLNSLLFLFRLHGLPCLPRCPFPPSDLHLASTSLFQSARCCHRREAGPAAPYPAAPVALIILFPFYPVLHQNPVRKGPRPSVTRWRR